MPKSKRFLLCWLTQMCVCIASFSQNTQKDSILLKDYLLLLEDQFGVKFSYLDKYVSTEIQPFEAENIEEILIYLEKQTELKFEFTNTSRIILRPFKSTDSITICGYVYENDFAKAGINVKSVLKQTETLTNDEGYFEIKEIPYESEIIFRKDGFFLVKISAKDLYKIECPKILIPSITEYLSEITLKQYLTKGIEKVNQKTVVKPKEFSVLAGLTEPDILSSLQHIPGVQNPFETASRLYVRGGLPDQNLVLWNGIRTYNQSHFFGLISAFNPYLITQVDFYNKGVNARYGDRVAGVIDMKSSQKVTNKFEGGLGTNLLHADAFAKVPIIENKLSVEVAGRRSFNNLWESETYKQMAERVFQNTKINENSVNGMNEFYFEDYSLGIQSSLSTKDNIQLNSLFAKNDLTFQSMSGENTFSDKLLTENEGYSLQWQHTYSDKLTQQTKVNFSNYLLDYEFISDATANEPQKKDSKQNFINDFGIQTLANYRLNERSKIQFGYEFSENRIRYSIRNSTENVEIILDEQNNTLTTNSFFGEYVFQKRKSFLAEIGIRANSYSVDSKLFVEPRLFIEKRIFPHLYINSSFTFRSQAITQIQESVVSSLSLENQLWRITDSEDFKVLETNQISFGANYRDASWYIEADTYYKNTDNVTTVTSGFITPGTNATSNGESRVFGAELFIKKKFKNYASWVSYNYNNQMSRFENINSNNLFVSNLNISHTFKWLHFYKLKNLQFSLSWIWHSGKATTDEAFADQLQTDPGFNQINTSNLPNYHKLDASALYNFKLNFSSKIRYQAGFSILNLYNRKSIINREFKSVPGFEDEISVVNYQSQGITPNLSLRVFW